MKISARAATLGTASALMLGAIAAPLLSACAPMFGLWVRWIFAAACHQQPERSFLLLGAPLAVCARCLGIYAGAALGSLLRMCPRVALNACAAALALNCVDVASELAGMHGNLPWLRLALGVALGAGAGALLSSPVHPSLRPETQSVLR